MTYHLDAFAVRTVLLKHDPVGIVFEDAENYDEYDGEVAQIVEGAKRCSTDAEIESLVLRVFEQMFSLDIMGPRDAYTDIAKELAQVGRLGEAVHAEPGDERRQALQCLIELSAPREWIESQFARFPRGSAHPVRLEARHVRAVLERYLASKLGARSVEEWASRIEGRGDIEDSPELRAILFELANPAITQELTMAMARELASSLR